MDLPSSSGKKGDNNSVASSTGSNRIGLPFYLKTKEDPSFEMSWFLRFSDFYDFLKAETIDEAQNKESSGLPSAETRER
jgi:predicted secreted protein